MLLKALEGFDLIPVYMFITFVGALLCVDNIVLVAHRRIGYQDPPIFHWLRRVSLVFLALAFLLSLSYADEKGWQPWGPDLVMRFAVCLWLAATSISVRGRDLDWRRNSRRAGLRRKAR